MASQDSHQGPEPIFSPLSSSHNNTSPSTSTCQHHQKTSFAGRGTVSTRQESTGTGTGLQSRILLPSIYCAEEVGRFPASHRFEEIERVHPMSTFQDGIRYINQSTTEERRVDDEHRLLRCLPTCTSRPELQEVLKTAHPRTVIPVQCHVFRPECSSSSIHKANGTCSSSAEIQGHPPAPLFGRLAISGPVSSRSCFTYTPSTALIQQVGDQGEFREIRHNSKDQICILGNGYRSSQQLDQTNRRGDSEDLNIGTFTSETTVCSSSSASITHWSTQSRSTVYSSWTPTYSSHSVFCQDQSPRLEKQHRLVSDSGRIILQSHPMVDQLPATESRCTSSSTSTRVDSINRCQHTGLGSLPRGTQSIRALVSCRTEPTYLSTRTTSSHEGSTEFVTSCPEQGSSASSGQHISGSLYSQSRGDTLPILVQGDKGHPPVVFGEQDNASSVLSTRASKLHGGPVVTQQPSFINRMDASLSSVSQDSSLDSCARCRPFRHQTKSPAEAVCVTMPRSSGMADRCIFSGMDRNGSLCISTNQINSRGTPEVSEIPNTPVPSSSILAEPILVPRDTETAVRSTTPDTIMATTSSTTFEGSVPLQSSPSGTSRLATLRNKIRQAGFSSKVAEYAAAPQRESSLRLYQSHWKSFCSWCDERDTDPATASVQDIADFLVYLFEVRKLAPRTIANYRTAIASTLGSIDDVPISIHPCLSQLIKSFKISRPVQRPRVPEWDLSKVLRRLRSSDFEPPKWETVQDKTRCTWKTIFLLALASSSRRGELQALSRDPRDLVFSNQGMSMRVIPGFLAKTAIPGMDPAPFFIPALTPFSGSDSDDRLLCPVRMVRKYVTLSGGLSPKTRLFRKVRGEGFPTTQTIANWIKACVRFTHQHRPDLHVNAHEVRRMSASWAFHGGSHSVEEILQAGTWASSGTFSAYYLADVRLQPDGRYRMQPIVARKQLRKF